MNGADGRRRTAGKGKDLLASPSGDRGQTLSQPYVQVTCNGDPSNGNMLATMIILGTTVRTTSDQLLNLVRRRFDKGAELVIAGHGTS